MEFLFLLLGFLLYSAPIHLGVQLVSENHLYLYRQHGDCPGVCQSLPQTSLPKINSVSSARRDATKPVNQDVSYSNSRVEVLLHEQGIETVRRYNITTKEVNKWTQEIACGQIPQGFESMSDFESHVMDRITKK